MSYVKYLWLETYPQFLSVGTYNMEGEALDLRLRSLMTYSVTTGM
jgi:hypothetical protein